MQKPTRLFGFFGGGMCENGKSERRRKEFWLTKEGLTLLTGWAMDGLTNEGIAGKMGVPMTTFYRWQKDEPVIKTALRAGKDVVDYRVEGSLLKAALSGNVTAQIFWLKNRRPDKWRDQPQEIRISDDEIPRFVIRRGENGC